MNHHPGTGGTGTAAAGAVLLPTTLAAVLAAVLLAAGVSAVGLAAAARLRARGDAWPAGRSLLWVAAAACVPLAVALPEALRLAPLTAHVAQHVVLVVVLPVAAALAAPVSLALRVLPARPRRVLLALLHGRWARAVLSAPAVVVLQVSGLLAAFLTPLHHALAARPVLSLAVHAHMVAAGYLFAALVVGRDPLPQRPRTRERLVVLGLVAAAHDTVARLLLAHPPAGDDLADVRTAAHLLAGAGTVDDVGLAVLVLARWYAAGGRQLARERRRAGQPRASGPTTGPSAASSTGANSAVSPRAT